MSSFIEILPREEETSFEYSNDELKNIAIEHDLMKSDDKIENLYIGHFRGYDAIRCFIKCKLSKQIPGIDKNIKSVISRIIESLIDGAYDGKPIKNIIDCERKSLGESLVIFDDIMRSKHKILSFDRTCSLPSYYKTDIKLTYSEEETLSNIWKNNCFKLRSREDIEKFLPDNFDYQKIDAAIKFLSEKYISNY